MPRSGVDIAQAAPLMRIRTINVWPVSRPSLLLCNNSRNQFDFPKAETSGNEDA